MGGTFSVSVYPVYAVPMGGTFISHCLEGGLAPLLGPQLDTAEM